MSTPQTPVNARDPYGDPEGMVFDPGQLHASASLVILVKDAADALERHYPGWLWAIQPDENGGIVNILAMRLSGQWGYTLKISTLQNDVRNMAVMRAGGELLERFGFRAGPYSREAYIAMGTHLGGQYRADVSDMARGVQRNYRTSQIQNALRSGAARIVTDSDLAAAKRHAPNI